MYCSVALAVEDDLSETVLRQILYQLKFPLTISTVLKRNGYGYLKRIAAGLNNAAKGSPYILLTDLDNYECPLALINSWLPQPKHSNFLFRIAVREVESWVLADRERFSKFLGISIDLIPDNTDSLQDPKEFLISLTRRSRKRSLRDAIVPKQGSTATVGKNYNATLMQFLENDWRADVAAQHSSSLQRSLTAIRLFQANISNLG